MEKRYILGALLCFVALILWQVYLGPSISPPMPQAVPPPPPGEKVADAAPADEPAESEPPIEAPVEADTVQAEQVEEITVETDVFRVVLTNHGGRVVSWTLNEYLDGDGNPLQVVSPSDSDGGRGPLGILLSDPGLSKEVENALYRVERESLERDQGRGAGTLVRFRWSDGRGLEVVKELEFRDGEYLVGVDAEVVDRGRRLPAWLAWGPGFQTRHDANGGLSSYYFANQVTWDMGGLVTRAPGAFPFRRDIGEGISESGRLRWAGIEDQYFAALLVPRTGEGEFRAWPVDVVSSSAAAEPGAAAAPAETQSRPMVAVNVADAGALLYVGPKQYDMLQALGYDLQKVVWFSSISLFALMARLLYEVLVWIHAHAVPNYGVAIVIATVMLRIVLFPLNQFSMVRIKKSQTEMQKLQPKINAIRNKYRKKKDTESRAQMNQEVMALYKKEGINPMGGMMGCLPMLAQFPILIGFYDMLVAAVELRGAPFILWIEDLTLMDPYLVTPLLMGATMFIQQKMSATKMGDPTQQRIMMFTPVIFTVMFIQLPSGLVLYWFVNNLLGIGQQWLVNRHVGRLEKASQGA